MVYGITAVEGFNENVELMRASLSYMNQEIDLAMDNNEKKYQHLEIALLMNKISVRDIYGNR